MSRATPGQHTALHMTLVDVAMQRDWPPRSGQLQGPSAWWELTVAAYDRLQQRPAVLMPAIDGLGFDGNGLDFVRGPRRRRNLNVAEISEIVEYLRAWAIDQGVTLHVPEEKAA